MLPSSSKRRTTLRLEALEERALLAGTPVLDPVQDIAVSYKQASVQVTLHATDPMNLPLTYGAQVFGSNSAYDLEQQLALQKDPAASTGNPYYQNALGLGLQEKWLKSTNGSNSAHQGYYVILQDGTVEPWLGGSSVGTAVATLDPSNYADLSLIFNAQAPNSPAIFRSFNANVLTLTPPAGFQGTFKVIASADDGMAKATQAFKVSFTNHAPTIQTIADISVLHGQPVQAMVSAADADNDSLTFQVQVAGYNPAYDLEQQLALQKDPLSSAGNPYYQNALGLGLQERWLKSTNGSNSAHQGYYVILQDGTVEPWTGGSTTGAAVGVIDPAYYTNITTLITLLPPTPPAGASGSVSNGTLTLSGVDMYTGGLKVTVTASDGQLSTAQTFKVRLTDNAPTLAAINDVSATHGQVVQVGLTANDADNDPLMYQVQVAGYSPAYDLEQQLALQKDPAASAGNPYYQNALGLGLQEKWLKSTNGSNSAHQGYYVVLQDGTVKPWTGGSSTGTAVGTLGASFYADPTLLFTITPPVTPTGVTGNVVGSTLTLDGPHHITGPLTVTVTASDGVLSAMQTFHVLVPDQAPTLQTIGNTTLSHTVGSFNVALTAADADNDPLTFQVQLAGDNPAYDLEQQLALQKDPAASAGNPYYQNALGLGLQEKWLKSSNGSNSAHQGYYVILQDGTVKPWTGGSSTGTAVATLDPSVYADPTTLINAKPPTAPSGVTGSVTGTTLTLSGLQTFAGTIQVTVAASDGVLAGVQQFKVTVTNNAPTLASIGDVTATHGQMPVTVPLTAADGDNEALVYQVQIAGYSPAYDLEQQLALQKDPLASAGNPYYQNALGLGLQEKWLKSTNGSNSAHQGYYVILQDGTVKPWTGGSTTGTAVAILGASFYADPTLLFTAAAPVTPDGVGGNVIGSSSPVLNLFGLHGITGPLKVTVSASDGIASASQTFHVLVSDQTPTLQSIVDQTVSYKATSFQVTLNGADPDGDALAYKLKVTDINAAYDLEQQLALQKDPLASAGNPYYQNALGLGLQEKWLKSTNGANSAHQGYYVILQDGTVEPWTGGSTTGAVVATLNPSFYADPTTIFSAQPPADLPVTVMFNGNVATVTPPANLMGKPALIGAYRVTAIASDGVLQGVQTFKLNIIDNAPVLQHINDITGSAGKTVQVTLSASDADNDPLTYAVQVNVSSPPFDLQQQLHLSDPGHNFFQNALGLGLQEKWLRSSTSNLANGGWYVVLQDGTVKPWTGGSTTGAAVATLGASVYTDPSLLFNAQPPEGANVQASIAGNVLTLTPGAGFTLPLKVTVTVSDGILSTSQTFLVM